MRSKSAAREYEAGGDIRDSILKLLLTRDQTHPFPSVRSLELTRWVETGTYNRILDGDYPRRDGDAAASATGRRFTSTIASPGLRQARSVVAIAAMPDENTRPCSAFS